MMLARNLAVLTTAIAVLTVAACASDGSRSPHPELAPLWSDYEEMPAERAMVIAGDPRRGRWVAGVAGGRATQQEAQGAAMKECRTRRSKRRMQAACVVYAVGDEIVWRGR